MTILAVVLYTVGILLAALALELLGKVAPPLLPLRVRLVVMALWPVVVLVLWWLAGSEYLVELERR